MNHPNIFINTYHMIFLLCFYELYDFSGVCMCLCCIFCSRKLHCKEKHLWQKINAHMLGLTKSWSPKVPLGPWKTLTRTPGHDPCRKRPSHLHLYQTQTNCFTIDYKIENFGTCASLNVSLPQSPPPPASQADPPTAAHCRFVSFLCYVLHKYCLKDCQPIWIKIQPELKTSQGAWHTRKINNPKGINTRQL